MSASDSAHEGLSAPAPEAGSAGRTIVTPKVAVRRSHSYAQPSDGTFLLLGAPFSTDNMGVGALAMGALSILLRAAPRARIAFLDYGRESEATSVDVDGRRLKIPLINLRFSWKPFLPNNVVLVLALAFLASALPPGVRRVLISSNRILAQVDAAHSAFSVSGGDSFSDIYGVGRFFYVVFPQLIAILLGKPLVLLPQTIGPFDRSLPRCVARFLLRRASLVFTRDAGGVDDLRRFLGPSVEASKLRFSHDMGFAVLPRRPRSLLAPRVLDKTRYSRLLVGLNISGLLYSTPDRANSGFGLRVDYSGLVHDLVRVLIEEESVDVVLVPHVYGRGGESDVAAIDRIMAHMASRYVDRLFSLPGGLDQNEVKYVIGQCDFFVGSRMHACIAALSQAIPAVGIAYSDKFRGVFASAGVEKLVADPRRQPSAEIVRAVKEALADREQIRAQLRVVMPGLRARVLDLLCEPAS